MKITRQQKIDTGKLHQVYNVNDPDTVLFEGSKSACTKYAKSTYPALYPKYIVVGKLLWEKETNIPSTIPVKEDEGQQEGKHTPGEWQIYKGGINFKGKGIKIVSREDDLISGNGETFDGCVDICMLYDCEERHSNAQLIASAPQLKAENKKLKEDNRELLEALKELYLSSGRYAARPNNDSIHHEFTNAYIKADSTIAKHQ